MANRIVAHVQPFLIVLVTVSDFDDPKSFAAKWVFRGRLANV
jgi:hypothetical protein